MYIVLDRLRRSSTGIVKHDMSLHITELKTQKSTLSPSRYVAKTAITLMKTSTNISGPVEPASGWCGYSRSPFFGQFYADISNFKKKTILPTFFLFEVTNS